MSALDAATINILRNRCYVYDGIIENITDCQQMCGLSDQSLSLLNGVLISLNEVLANISSPQTGPELVQNLRENGVQLVGEYNNVLRSAQYNQHRVLTDAEDDGHNVTTQYSLPGMQGGTDDDEFTFECPKVSSAQLPRKGMRLKNGAGEDLVNADGAPYDYKLANLGEDLGSDSVTIGEFRKRVEQYIVVCTEAIRDVNAEIEKKKCDLKRLNFRSQCVTNLKQATARSLKHKREAETY